MLEFFHKRRGHRVEQGGKEGQAVYDDYSTKSRGEEAQLIGEKKTTTAMRK